MNENNIDELAQQIVDMVGEGFGRDMGLTVFEQASTKLDGFNDWLGATLKPVKRFAFVSIVLIASYFIRRMYMPWRTRSIIRTDKKYRVVFHLGQATCYNIGDGSKIWTNPILCYRSNRHIDVGSHIFFAGPGGFWKEYGNSADDALSSFRVE